MNEEIERYIDCHGVRLWTVASGVGIPVIVLNGGPGCNDYLAPVARLLDGQCRVVRFEQRGCGRSDYDGHYEFETTVADIECVRQAYEFDRVVLVGHSAGPNLALAYAIRWPSQVRGIIGISGGKLVDDRSWSETYHRNRDTIGDQVSQEFVADPEVNRLGNETMKAYARRPELLRELAAISCPVVFINASDDIRPNWPTQQLAQLIPNASYHEIEGAQHCPWMTHADTLQELLLEAVGTMNG
ncbi:MAG TPA: alpha/beta hydrolase [Pseudomonadales bacterium]|nr:alpha/beta hydrolase [Pseudomonadales bacterium]